MIIEINTQSTLPIYEQLRDQIVLGLAAGRLTRGEALPSVRGLAADLGINLHTVAKAYAILGDEGYIVMDRRRGAVAAEAMSGDEDFFSKLSRQLTLAAAEAVCRDMNEAEFLRISSACYMQARNNPKGNSENRGAL